MAVALMDVGGQRVSADVKPTTEASNQQNVVEETNKEPGSIDTMSQTRSEKALHETDNPVNSDTINVSASQDNENVVNDYGERSIKPVVSQENERERNQQSLLNFNAQDKARVHDDSSDQSNGDSANVPYGGSGEADVGKQVVQPRQRDIGNQANVESIDQWMPNKRLQQAILKNLNGLDPSKQWHNVSEITKKDMLLLTEFVNANTYIDGETAYSLQGLEYATNLTSITLNYGVNSNGNSDGSHAGNFYQGDVRDISPLGKLTKLTSLDIQDNKVSDVSVLAHLTNLTEFDASMNYIGDFRPLKGLSKLEKITCGNQFVKLAPIYIDRKKLTAHIAGNYYLADGSKAVLIPQGALGEPIRYDSQSKYPRYFRWYVLGLKAINLVNQDGNGGLNFSHIREQQSGEVIPDGFQNTSVVKQKELYFLLGVYKSNNNGSFIDLSVVQPYILIDKAATVTVHYQDEAGKKLTEDQVFSNGSIGETYTTRPKEIKGYTFKRVKDHNATGKYTATPQTVVYIYTANGGQTGGNHGETDPETPPVVPGEPMPTNPSQPAPEVPAPVPPVVPDIVNDEHADVGGAGDTIQTIEAQNPLSDLSSESQGISVTDVKAPVKNTQKTLPQTNEQKSQLKIWGIALFIFGFLGSAIRRRQ